MKTNYILFVLLIILGVFTLMGWRNNYLLKEYLDEVSMKANGIEENISKQSRSLSQRAVLHSMIAEPFTFLASTTFLDERNEKISARSLVDKNTMLIFKISKRNCSSCIEAELAFLEDLYTKNLPLKRLAIFAEDYNARELILTKEKYKIKFPMYSVDGSLSEALSIEKLNQPYLFLLDKSLAAKMFFAPDKALPEMSQEYYNQINYLFSK